MQTLVVGDIHGCYFELQTLLDKAGISEDDAIIGIGDIVDRGPETPEVLNFFRETPNAQAVIGNHERKHVRAARHEVKLSISQLISQKQFGATYPDALNWMSILPLFIELPEAVIVHGFMEPGISLINQNPMVLCGTMGGDKILRERYNRPWYELYDGNKPLIVGHENYTNSNQPFVYKNKVFGLDTSCVTGKCLTGILMPSFQFISVPSRGDLWAQVRLNYKQISRGSLLSTRLRIDWSESDDKMLSQVIENVIDKTQALQKHLQSLSGYRELNPRQQAKYFADKSGTGHVAILMQLARLDKLHLESAHKVIEHPDNIENILITLGLK